jgi:hypothetical protein
LSGPGRIDTFGGKPYTAPMLKTKDLENFMEYLESGAWADAFAHAEESLRLEMIEKVEMLLDAADAADKVVGEVLFNKDGLPGGGGKEGGEAGGGSFSKLGEE